MRHHFTGFGVAALLLAAACTGKTNGGTLSVNLPAEYSALAPCIMSSLQTTVDSFGKVGDLLAALSDPNTLATVATPTNDPKVWNFDTGVLLGTVTFSVDPTGGFTIGDTATVMFDYESGDVFGSGNLSVELIGTDTVEVSGTAGFDDISMICVLNIDIEAASPLTIDLSGVRQTSANVGGADIIGPMHIAITHSPDQLMATVVFESESDTISINDTVLNGTPSTEFSIPLSGLNS